MTVVEQDAIVDQVRRIRREIESQCGDDFVRIREHLLGLGVALARAVVNRAPVSAATFAIAWPNSAIGR